MDSGFQQQRGRFIPTDDKTWSPTTARFVRRQIAQIAARGPTQEEAAAFPRLFSSPGLSQGNSQARALP